VVSWNVNRRVRTGLDRQIEAIAAALPDLVALQEVTTTTVAAWCRGLARIGLAHQAIGFDRAPDAIDDRRRARSSVLLASCWPLRDVEGIAAPWRERTASAIVDTPSGPIEIHTVYVPEGATGPQIGRRWLRAETFETIHERLSRPASMPTLLCGDLNAPHAELPDGTIVPFGRPGRDADAELSVLRDLARFGLVDAFRTVHGFGVPAYSWRGRRYDYRIDHVFASVALSPVRAEYHCHLLDARLSDHAALDVSFDYGSQYGY